jgi:hypothetical protein
MMKKEDSSHPKAARASLPARPAAIAASVPAIVLDSFLPDLGIRTGVDLNRLSSRKT